jgi:hypothetical protein
MDKDELIALRAAIDELLAWPDQVRDQVARWLAPPKAAKPNGRDPHPPPMAATGTVLETKSFPPRRSPTPYAGKARHAALSKGRAEAPRGDA